MQIWLIRYKYGSILSRAKHIVCLHEIYFNPTSLRILRPSRCNNHEHFCRNRLYNMFECKPQHFRCQHFFLLNKIIMVVQKFVI